MKECLERLQLAVGQDANIICADKEEATKHPGNEESYLSVLGLEKKHLKRLERLGRAFRGYVVTSKGYRKRWLLLNGPS